jgi:hypothetical protein
MWWSSEPEHKVKRGLRFLLFEIIGAGKVEVEHEQPGAMNCPSTGRSQRRA